MNKDNIIDRIIDNTIIRKETIFNFNVPLNKRQYKKFNYVSPRGYRVNSNIVVDRLIKAHCFNLDFTNSPCLRFSIKDNPKKLIEFETCKAIKRILRFLSN